MSDPGSMPDAGSTSDTGFPHSGAPVSAPLTNRGSKSGVIGKAGTSLGTMGAGLHNLGNSCFMNAVLQCLAHTPPLNNYMRRKVHSGKCARSQKQQPGGHFCSACRLEMLVLKMFSTGVNAFPPKTFLEHLPVIARGFRQGRQEDAHEFLRCLLEHLTKCFNPSIEKNPLTGLTEKRSKEGSGKHTVIQSWFQGLPAAARAARWITACGACTSHVRHPTRGAVLGPSAYRSAAEHDHLHVLRC